MRRNPYRRFKGLRERVFSLAATLQRLLSEYSFRSNQAELSETSELLLEFAHGSIHAHLDEASRNLEVAQSLMALVKRFDESKTEAERMAALRDFRLLHPAASVILGEVGN